MPKGAQAKEVITQKILDAFPGSFRYDKEIRIPWNEDGIPIQLKVTLTCAKNNVSNGDDNAMPGESINSDEVPFAEINSDNFGMNQPTDEEKKAVSDLLEKLGLT